MPVPTAPTAPSGAATLLTVAPREFAAECERAIAQARIGAATIKAVHAARDGAGVLAAYDAVTATVDDARSRASLAENVHPDPAFREAAEKAEQALGAFAVELSLDRDVYDALVAVDVAGEDDATRYWIEKTLLEFRRAGVDRDDATRARVKALNEELVRVGQEFGKNIREDVRTLRLAPAELDGLPDDYRRRHPAEDGVVAVTTNYPDYLPFMTYAKSASARATLWRAYRERGHPKNLEVLSKLLAIRHALATLLGYSSWAAYTLETKMARTDSVVEEFIRTVTDSAAPRAHAEMADLLAFKRTDDPAASSIEPWEHEQLQDRLKAAQLGFDSQAFRPYFEFAAVQRGVMGTMGRIFEVRFDKVSGVPVWHPDVETFDVMDGEQCLGRVHLDMHPRDGKYQGAAQFDLTGGQRGVSPEAVLVCNFPRSKASGPGLLQPGEVETFFHEFGHLMHHVFAGHQRWAGISGIRTEWDFVEVPSMLLQEWAVDPHVLRTFARHHATGEPIADELVEKLRTARDFGKGLATRRQMFLAAVSLDFHRQPPGFDTTARLADLQQQFLPFRREHVDGTYFHLAFAHLDGYSAAYYTYLWSEVIAKDLLTGFQHDGLLSSAPARRLRDAILAPGGSKPAAQLVRDFLGRDYSFDAFARWMRAG